eukprot:4251781-Pyramimonas_sp.AAC.1
MAIQEIRASTQTDTQRASYFLTEVWLNNTVNWLQEGEEAETAVFYVAAECPAYLALSLIHI